MTQRDDELLALKAAYQEVRAPPFEVILKQALQRKQRWRRFAVKAFGVSLVSAAILMLLWKGSWFGEGEFRASFRLSPVPQEIAGHKALVLSGVFESDTTLRQDRVVLPSNGTLRILNGAHLVIETDVLEVGGPFLFDGRGNQGAPGVSPADWTSSGSCFSLGPFGPGEVAHSDWEKAGGHPDDRGGNGQPGGPGATVEIYYKRLIVPNGGSWQDYISTRLEGGDGGPGAQGRRLICGCHPEHTKYGPRGTQGGSGSRGQFLLQRGE